MSSPYARAVKHVAVRGKLALGPSARDMERQLYLKSILPPDYRPPNTEKWDDMIERWSYAWQYPVEESVLSESNSIVKSGEVVPLLEFIRGIQSSPSYTKIDGKPRPLLPSSTSGELVPCEPIDQDTPVAYLDFDAPITKQCKDLAIICVEKLGIPFDESGMVSLIAAIGKTKDIEATQTMFDFSVAIGFQPKLVAYTALLSSYALVPDVNTCLSIIETMKSNGITPSVVTWTIMMNAFTRAGDPSSALQIFDHMKAYANIEPNELTFHSAIMAHARNFSREGSAEAAIELFEHMQSSYGMMPLRRTFTALLIALCYHGRHAALKEYSKKMELLGYEWKSIDYELIMESSAKQGDVQEVRKLFLKMNESGLNPRQGHIVCAMNAHSILVKKFDYAAVENTEEKIDLFWKEQSSIALGLFEFCNKKKWPLLRPLNGVLQMLCEITIATRDNKVSLKEPMMKYRNWRGKVDALWNSSYAENNVTKNSRSYALYITMLARCGEVAQAESTFQEMALTKLHIPEMIYREMMFMHLRSAEDGAVTRALNYMEAMERSGIAPKAGLLLKFRKLANEASYLRDMRRRSKRMEQAKEEYENRKSQGDKPSEGPIRPKPRDPIPEENPLKPMQTSDLEYQVTPVPPDKMNAAVWWADWKEGTVSKHELFDGPAANGTPQGEDFKEKNVALEKMGIHSKFLSPADVPDPKKNTLLERIRRDGSEPSAALWAVDGGNLKYPTTQSGPGGWDTTLWRERNIIKKEYERAERTGNDISPFSQIGISRRTVPEQLEIERTNASNPGELSDAKVFPHDVFDDGTRKPMSQVALGIPPTAELIWVKEQNNPLAPYFAAEESMNPFHNENALQSSQSQQSKSIQGGVAAAIMAKKESDLMSEQKLGGYRNRKYNFLQRFKDMYSRGQLEVPDEPLLRFGRTPEDPKHTTVAAVKAFYEKQKRNMPTEESVQELREKVRRHKHKRVGRKFNRPTFKDM